MRGQRDDIAAIKAGLDIVQVCTERLGVVLRRDGRDLVGLSPFKAEKTPSFKVDARKQIFYCFATSQGGDVVRLLALIAGVEDGEMIKQLRADSGVSAETPQQKRERIRVALARQQETDLADKAEKRRKTAIALDIWNHASESKDLIETYLASRGIDPVALHDVYGRIVPVSIRCAILKYFNGGVHHEGPAMVGALVRRHVAGGGYITGIHRTWLADDGIGKADLPNAKLTLGTVWGSACPLSDPGEHAIVGEGYETTFSVMAALATRGQRVFGISAASLGNLAGAGKGAGLPHPVRDGLILPSQIPDRYKPGLRLPPCVRRVTILADNDGRDRHVGAALVDRAEAKFLATGIDVAIAWPEAGTDFNDMMQSGHGGADVARAVALAGEGV